MPSNLQRLRAVAILRFGSVDRLHKQLPLCSNGIAYQFQRGSLSEQVRQALVEQIGEDGLRFVLGETNTLTVEGAQ